MKRVIVILFSVFILYSCKSNYDKTDNLEILDFGYADYYEPFLGVKEDVAYFEKELHLEFNDYARSQDAFVTIAFVTYNQKLLCELNKRIKIYFNDVYSKNGSFIIKANNLKNKGVVKVGIKVLPGSEQGEFTGFLLVLNHNVDRVGENSLDKDKRILKWAYEYNKVHNPLVLFLFWFSVLFILFLIVWFAYFRNRIYPKIKYGTLIVTEPYYKNIQLRGIRSLVCTNKARKQTWFDRKWRGKILYEEGLVWEETFILKPGKRKGKLNYRLSFVYQIINKSQKGAMVSTIDRYVEYEIKNNSTKEKINIQYN